MKRDLQHLIREEERTHGVRFNSLRSYVKHALTAGAGDDDVDKKVEAALERREQEKELKTTEANQHQIIKRLGVVEKRLGVVETRLDEHAKAILQARQQKGAVGGGGKSGEIVMEMRHGSELVSTHVNSVAWSGDGTRVASGGLVSRPDDGTVMVWDAQSGDEVMAMSHGVVSVASGGGTLVVSGGMDGRVVVWKAKTETEGKTTHNNLTHKDAVSMVER